MIHRFLLIACLAVSCSWVSVYAEAPVVDGSEQFALLDEQQAGEQPVATDQKELGYNEEQSALARDDTPTTGNHNLTLLNKIQGLQQDIQELRGQLEIQAHELKLLQEQQLAFYKDLDSRLSHSSTASLHEAPNTELAIEPTAQATSTATSPARSNPADEQISYLAAYDLVRTKHYHEALTALSTFIVQYPQGGYTANAHYWLGELYLLQKDYAKAQEQFESVLKQFPASSKCSASLLKIGYALAASGRAGEAKLRFHEVMKKYPDTQIAQLASDKLATLGG